MSLSTERSLILRCYIIIILLIVKQPQLWAQYNMPQNDVWTFATSEGVNFLPGPAPVSITSSSSTQEGSASVSDNSGHLLFYTEGINSTTGAKVRDRTGTVMPHGSAIVPFATYSCTQAAAIVPVIGNPDQYYVFSLEQGGGVTWGTSTSGFCHLYYCIVDMTLNGGFGDVITATLATPLDSGLSEKMTVVAGDNCNIWLLAHQKDAPVFKSYNISSAGISVPVVSAATGEIPTGLNAYKIGTIKVSPDRTMISNCVVNGAYLGGTDRLELLQFDPATGIVSGCKVLNYFTNQYDADFSPDNSKLYSRVMGSRVYQYDLSLLPDVAAVISSQFLVYTSPNWGGQMKLGPNGKMYLQTGAAYLDCINSPDLPGSSCDYTYHAVHLAGFVSSSNLGMPNMQITANLTDTMTTRTDTTGCALAGITLNAPYGSAWYSWSNGATTQSAAISGSGTYWVKSAHGCSLQIDTFHVTATPSALIPTGTSTSFCTGSSVILTAPLAYTAHVWSTGATAASITVTAAGTYWVADTNLSACSLQVDTFHVTATPVTLIPTITAANLCPGSSATLTAPASYTAHVWNTGATTASVTVAATGNYWVTDTNLSACTIRIDTFHVTAQPLALIPTTTSAGFCAGSSAMLTAPAGYTAYGWNTGATTAAITVAVAGNYWVTDTSLITCAVSIDTFHVTAITPALIPTITAANLCAGSSAMLTAPAGYIAHVWNTGAITPAITVATAGNYWVTDTNLSTCAISIDTFHVTAIPLTLVPIATPANFCTGASATLIAPAAYTAHVWNTGITTASVTVTTAGTYWVADTIFSTCNLLIDTFHVSATPITIVPSVLTTSFCTWSSLSLTAPAGYTAHVWNTGATTLSVTVTAAGTYWVADTIFSTCHLHVDTFHVTAILPVLFPAATSRSFCSGSSVILTAPAGHTAHVWNTGETTLSVTKTMSGTYWVADTILSTCNLLIDTFHVTAILPSMIPQTTSVSFCTGTSIILTAPAGYTSYVWNTSETTLSVTATTSGTYWVADTNLTICTIQTDTFNIVEKPAPLVDMGNDTTICLGDLITLSSSLSAGTFLWSTGSTASSITVNAGGTYYLTVTDNNCSVTDSIRISQLSAPSPIILGADTTLCNGDMLILRSGSDTALWSTGVMDNRISVTYPGTYLSTVTNACGSSTSSINVSFVACNLDFPNAFTPNNDGRNDVARAIGYLNAFKKYTLSIYNRFGQRVFYTEDIYAGWDGIFNNVPQDLGTYFYMITYSLKGDHHMLKGDLTLIR